MVFFLPAALDRPRDPTLAGQRLTALLEAVEEGDASAVAEAVEPELPPAVRNTPAGWAYLRQRLDQLMRDGLGARTGEPAGAGAAAPTRPRWPPSTARPW